MAATITDITPSTAHVHKIVVLAADVPTFLGTIDSTAPSGKLATGIDAQIDKSGNITLKITYAP